VHESNARNIPVKLSLTQLTKMLCPPYYASVFSSTKLEIRAEQVLSGRQQGGGERVGEGNQGEK
jgi:hypothetical protein